MTFIDRRKCIAPKLYLLSACLFVSHNVLADHPTLGLQQDAAGAITTLSAITLPQGAVSFGLDSQTISNHVISDSDLAHFAEIDEEVHSTDSVNSLSINAAFGFTNNLTIGFNLPYITRTNLREGDHHHAGEDDQAGQVEDVEAEEGGIENLGDPSGLGDLTLYGQYRFVGDNDSRLHASLLFGLKVPTGKTDVVSDEGERLETEHQPGTGSWDPLLGIAMTHQWKKLTLDSNILYEFAGTGSQDSSIGDIFNYNVALSYRLGQSAHHGHSGHHHDEQKAGRFWDVALELNGEWRDRVTVADERQHHTGGNLLYLAPSVRFSSGSGWSAYASLGVPIIEDLNGVQSDPKYRLFVGITTGFGGRL